MKNKGAVLFATDLIAAITLGGLIVTGAVMQWVLPHGGGPGSGSGHGRGRAGETAFLALSRHDWGDVHFWVSVAFVVAIAFHLLLHIGWIKTAFARYLWLAPRKRAAAQPAATT